MGRSGTRTRIRWRAEDGRTLGLFLPAKFAVDDLPYEVTFEFDVDENDDIVVAGLNVQRRPGGRPVTASGVRYWPLEDWQRQAIKAEGREMTLNAKGQWGVTVARRNQINRPITDTDAEAAIRDDPYTQWRRTPANAKLRACRRGPRRHGQRVPDGLKLGDNRTKTMAEVFRKHQERGEPLGARGAAAGLPGACRHVSREGSVKRDSSSRWMFVVDVTPVGAVKRKQVRRRGFRTKAEALEALDEVKYAVADRDVGATITSDGRRVPRGLVGGHRAIAAASDPVQLRAQRAPACRAADRQCAAAGSRRW